jgi:citronellol/citronellal dehydrogenase
MKRYDLMHQVNGRGSFLCSKLCLPHLEQAENPHILTLAPPLELEPAWFASHVAYTVAKYSMSLYVLGMAKELERAGVAVNALWPKTVIATAAVENLLGGAAVSRCARKPEIVADAAYAILSKPSRQVTGRFFIDEEVLKDEGVTDFSGYAVDPSQQLLPDLFVK